MSRASNACPRPRTACRGWVVGIKDPRVHLHIQKPRKDLSGAASVRHAPRDARRSLSGAPVVSTRGKARTQSSKQKARLSRKQPLQSKWPHLSTFQSLSQQASSQHCETGPGPREQTRPLRSGLAWKIASSRHREQSGIRSTNVPYGITSHRFLMRVQVARISPRVTLAWFWVLLRTKDPQLRVGRGASSSS